MCPLADLKRIENGTGIPESQQETSSSIFLQLGMQK
jgi:hypothetical protein